MNATPAFITGSHAFGTPTPKSDVDLVVYIGFNDARRLDALHGGVSHDYGDDSTDLVFGNMNLIVCTSLVRYKTWKRVTDQLLKRKPVKRADGIKAFQLGFSEEG